MCTDIELQYHLKQIAEASSQQSFRRLFVHFYPPLKQFAFAIVKSQQSAEEIASDVLMNIWQQREKLHTIVNLKVYLYVSTRNIALNYLKKQQRQATLDLDDMTVSALVTVHNPEEIFISTELLHKCNQAIQQLPPRCRLIFKLIREDGLKYKEVAHILDISHSTVAAQMAIACKKIGAAIHLNLGTYLLREV
ncbi:RNA polymerase sigma-70 factor, ECF subfamily [Chitinophaga costaii]|uniref:RNA polymerase sigma-70 factor, ECF subfamily n=1 Tax=Chitinophaga costaii TaxID=1335309 RepID=A0A1C4CK19_9BACT|nr:RNA polymerase sigma-70 factor [Chitinophaga costaii]PUZ27060.1 RNA polymerase sigma-70 factor [Chitinophaga costaii]SCC19388.1 RNA polymerase sigma-70 factor, ECF subfamily [Chitinophaga costaii]